MFPATETTLKLGMVKKKNPKPSLSVQMAERADKMLVCLIEKPCIFVLPPHCYHLVFTFTSSAHAGTRVSSSIWKDDMRRIVEFFMDPLYGKWLRQDKDDKKAWFERCAGDLMLWVKWAAKVLVPTPEEKEIIDILVKMVPLLPKFEPPKQRG